MSGADIYALARCGGMRYVEELQNQGIEIIAVEKNAVSKIPTKGQLALIPPVPESYIEQEFEAQLAAHLLARDEDGLPKHRVTIFPDLEGATVSAGLAHQLTANQEIIQAFPDGVYWFDTHWRSKNAFLQELVARARLEVDQDLETRLGESYLQHTWDTWINAPGRRCLFVFDGLEYQDFHLCGLFKHLGREAQFVVNSKNLDITAHWIKRHIKTYNLILFKHTDFFRKKWS